MLDQDDRDYLKSRGYTDQMIDLEGWSTWKKGVTFTGSGLILIPSRGTMGAECKFVNGVVTAYTALSRMEKAYRRYKTVGGSYLPVYFSSADDNQKLLETENVFLVEGIFDRVALKRAMVQGAVFSLQGLGLSQRMVDFLSLIGKRVWLMLDQDEPGLRAMKSMTKALKARDIRVERIEYPFKDPSLWFERRGALNISQRVCKEVELRGWG